VSASQPLSGGVFAYLSEHANPGYGSYWRLTEKDVEVLRRVKTLLDSDLSLEAIAVQLRKELTEPLADLPAPSAAGSESRDPWPTLEDALARIAIQDQRFAQLEARFERLN
jgi:DNA-binding transcriptional MerR regulator